MTKSSRDLRQMAELLELSADTMNAAATCLSGRRLEQVADAVQHTQAAARKMRDAAQTSDPADLLH